ncbi:MAG TPA: hypothetical protein VGC42_02190 [Kofleriaceae bacterium]
MRTISLASLVLLGCGASAQQIEIAPPPAKETRAVLAGNLCQAGHCACRDGAGDGGAGTPNDAAHKRFEFRLGPTPQELWLTINGHDVLYKSAERADACFYVDLPTGAQQVELRASNPDGVSVALAIHELGTTTKSWYDTFQFACGSPGVCSFEELEANKAQYASGRTKNLFDRCGTTKVKAISWDHGKAPDQQHPSELLVRLTLDIYKHPAFKEHGDDTCGHGDRQTPDGMDAAPDTAPDHAPLGQ